jgi:hypothetical protein
MAENLSNRITSLDSAPPELLAEIKANIRAAVREVVDQYRAAQREHPEEMLEARDKYFGTSL